MTRDTIYKDPREKVAPFEFDASVARVFNDMIHRSVPFYGEIIGRQVALCGRINHPRPRFYDLGCSNGNFGLHLCEERGRQAFDMIAVDNSAPMLKAFARRLQRRPRPWRVHLVCADLLDVKIEKASVVILNFTLQFLPRQQRDDLIRRIYQALLPGGMLLFSEKIRHQGEVLSQLQVDFYYAFKREHGYSDLEISQKREALETVLLPESVEAHRARLERAGFQPHMIDIWLKWFNFSSWICLK